MKIEDIYTIYSKHFLVDTDTRNIRKNAVFFALKGKNFNGNEFAEKALRRGAIYSIVDEKKYQTNANIILVDSVLKTLQQLANFHRRHLDIPIIGITGSNGKTTTKELINCVLSTKYVTTATKGNLNNHIGVPLTLLSMSPKTEIGIVEMGANHKKEIEFLCSIAEPDFGYVTNFGKAHLEGFGGIEGVIKGKSELYTYLHKNNKIAFANPNDEIQIEKTKHIKTIFFSKKDVAFTKVNPFVQLKFKGVLIQSNLIGLYNYTNIVAAITIANYFRVSATAIKDSIEQYIPTNNRSQIIHSDSNKIILDAYNANPTSMEAALENFAQLEKNDKTVILGDMFELGKDSLYEHQVITNLLVELNFKNVFLVGENFAETDTKFLQFKTNKSFENFIIKNPIKNNVILIKGSRSMGLERILTFL